MSNPPSVPQGRQIKSLSRFSCSLIVSSCLLTLALSSCEKVLPFTKQTYRAIDDTKVIELISSDELELRDSRMNLICKYSREGDKIRATLTMMGTSQAVYYSVTPDGLVDPQGLVLYEPVRYSAVMAQVEAERRQAQLDQSLFNVAAAGDADGVRAFIRQGARVDALTQNGQSSLYTAVRAGQIEAVKALLEAKADPNIADSEGNTPLMLAADKGGESSMFRQDRSPAANPILKVLLDHKAVIDAQSNDGSTALIYAISSRNLEGCRILIVAGANRDIKDSQGKSALDFVMGKKSLLINVDEDLEALRTEKERAFLKDSRTAKKVLGEFQEYEEPYGLRKPAPLSRKTEITDVGLVSPQYNNRSEIKVWFGSIEADAISKRDSGNERSLFGKSTPQFEVLIKWEVGYRSLLFLDSQERDRCFETLKEALNAWGSRYGDPTRIPNPDAEKMVGQSTSGTLNPASTADASNQMATSAPKAEDAAIYTIPFLNCTLTYTSHSSDWSVFFGGEAKGKGAYWSKAFEGRGGRTYTGEVDYGVVILAEEKWKITTLWGQDKDSRQEIVFWITEGDARSGTLKAVGNIYDLRDQPMWPGGERAMEMIFTRGKQLSGGNDASERQMTHSEPKFTEANIQTFIASHHLKASRGDIENMVSDYDQTVTFLDKGQVSPALIQEEETKDRAKWPRGGEWIIGQPTVVETTTQWLASYTIEFHRENVSGGWMSGKIDLNLAIRSEGSRLLISSQKAKVYDLKKSKGR